MPGERKPVTVIGNKTGTSQVGAISTAKIKSKEGPFGDKKIRESRTVPKKRKGPEYLLSLRCHLHSSGFVGYVKKVKKQRGIL